MRPATTLLLASLLGLTTGLSAVAQEGTDFKPVEVETLRKDLSKFWAVGFTFLDTVTESPAAMTIQVAKKSYVRFATRTLGVCYADASLGSKLDELKTGADFVFTATVLQNERSLFSFGRPTQYFVAAMKFQPALAEATPEAFLKAGSNLPGDSADGRMLKNYSALLVGLQADLAALARTRGLETSELMKSASTNRPEVERIITTGIESLADQMEVRLPDVLGQLTLALLASQMQPAPKPPPAIDQPAPAVVEKADPASVQADAEAQRKLERQKQAEQAAAEKKRIADAQAAKAAAEKQARLEQQRIKDEQAAAEAARARADAEAEKKRIVEERAAKAAAMKQAELERERAAAEKQARDEQARAEREKAEAAAKAAAAEAAKKAQDLSPKMRVPTPAKTNPTDPAPSAGDVTPAQPSAKLQPAPPPPAKPSPEKAPAPQVEDYNAPIPL